MLDRLQINGALTQLVYLQSPNTEFVVSQTGIPRPHTLTDLAWENIQFPLELSPQQKTHDGLTTTEQFAGLSGEVILQLLASIHYPASQIPTSSWSDNFSAAIASEPSKVVEQSMSSSLQVMTTAGNMNGQDYLLRMLVDRTRVAVETHNSGDLVTLPQAPDSHYDSDPNSDPGTHTQDHSKEKNKANSAKKSTNDPWWRFSAS